MINSLWTIKFSVLETRNKALISLHLHSTAIPAIIALILSPITSTTIWGSLTIVIIAIDFILIWHSEAAFVTHVKTSFTRLNRLLCSAFGPSIQQLLLVILIELLLDLQLVLHDLLLSFKEKCLTVHLSLLAIQFAWDRVLETHIEVHSDLARVLGLEPKTIDNISLSLLINELSPD